MRDINDLRMQDLHLFGCCLRVFWRGFGCSPVYYFHRWGFYGFGLLALGFMFWPPAKEES